MKVFQFIYEQGKELHMLSLRVTELTSELENMKTENSKLRQQTFDNEKKAKPNNAVTHYMKIIALDTLSFDI
jgi:hypothetical protein